jgi:DNA (cytosine-5)-methyltransferase 1
LELDEMSAYYNEIDPYAAEWLRNLIAGGHIAPGVVDERSIEDVTPDEIREFTQCHFFAGIGIWSAALRRSGWDDERPVWTGSCPCQPFSAAGKGGGFDDERHLWPAWHWLIAELQPRTIFGEQVASKDGLGWFDLVSADMEGTSYAVAPIDLCAAGVGAPHLRQRLWFAAERLANANGGNPSPQWKQRGGQHGQLEADGGAECLAQPNSGECDRRSEATRGHNSDRSDARRQESYRRIASSESNGRLAHTDDARSQGRVGCRPHGAQGEQVGHGAERGSSDGMADPSSIGRQARGSDYAEHDGRFADAAGTTSELANTSSVGRQQERTDGDGGAVGDRPQGHTAGLIGGSGDHGPGATNGHWREADWLFCTDGKWRPVEPGTFPLAHGLGSRMGRLRAYGNGICLEAAQAVIESFLDCRP